MAHDERLAEGVNARTYLHATVQALRANVRERTPTRSTTRILRALHARRALCARDTTQPTATAANVRRVRRHVCPASLADAVLHASLRCDRASHQADMPSVRLDLSRRQGATLLRQAPRRGTHETTATGAAHVPRAATTSRDGASTEAVSALRAAERDELLLARLCRSRHDANVRREALRRVRQALRGARGNAALLRSDVCEPRAARHARCA